ncbi:uncharacterized protein [Lolium perenne]|uniref:uncharacterized protein n=1 Tax=Lolium perenne TaxID=4522 RepID=UPI0021F511EE|nr:uncharacterized protein LOC127302386 [Lolium perenne]
MEDPASIELFADRGDDHLLAIPEEQTPRTWTVLDADQVGFAAAAAQSPSVTGRPMPAPTYTSGTCQSTSWNSKRNPKCVDLTPNPWRKWRRGGQRPHFVEMLRQASIQYDHPQSSVTFPIFFLNVVRKEQWKQSLMSLAR